MSPKIEIITRERLTGPPQHTKSLRVQVNLIWQNITAEASLLLDSGATGPVLSRDWVRQTQLPSVRRKVPASIADASGNNIPASGVHYTKTVRRKMGTT